MDQLEFSIAIHLVRKKLQGVALPKVLPASIKVDPGKPGSVTTSPVQQVPKQQQASAAPVSQTAKATATPPPQTAKHTPPAAVRSPPLSELLLIYVIITIYRISNSVWHGWCIYVFFSELWLCFQSADFKNNFIDNYYTSDNFLLFPLTVIVQIVSCQSTHQQLAKLQCSE